MTYPSEVLADAPLAYYRAGETPAANGSAPDSSGNGRHATHNATPADLPVATAGLLVGDADGALLYNGKLGPTLASQSFMNTSHTTIEAVVDVQAPAATGMIVARDDNGSNLTIRIDTNGGQFRAIANVGGSYITAQSATSAGVHHLAATYDGTAVRLYVDGVQTASTNATGVLAQNSGYTIGSATAGFDRLRFTGVIDEAAFYGVALSPTRIAAHHAAATTAGPGPRSITLGRSVETDVARSVITPVPGSTSAYAVKVLEDVPAAYWPLQEASGIYADASGNGRTLTDALANVTREASGGPVVGAARAVVLAGSRLDSNLPFTGIVDSTLEFWCRTTVGVATVATSRGSVGTHRSFTTFLGVAPVGTTPGVGRLAYGMSGDATWRGAAATSPAPAINDDAWHHVVIVLDGTSGAQPDVSSFRAYVDGVEVPDVTSDYPAGSTAVAPHTASVWQFFNSTPTEGTGGAFNARVAHLSVYDKALTSERVAAHYAARNGAAASPQVVSLGRAVESSSAQTLARVSPLVRAVGRATQASTARVLTPVAPAGPQSIPLGRASGTQSARTIASVVGGSAQQVALNRATSTGIVRLVMVVAAPPVVTPPGGGSGGGAATRRWVLRDTATAVEWTMPINPDSMSSPFARRALKFGRGWRRDERVRTFQGPSEAHEWEWAGVIRSKDHYDRLVEWAEKSVAIDVTDHLGRTFRIFIEEFNPVDRRPTPNVTWRLRYTMKARVLERVG